jgi:hypothetical protein
MKNICRAGAGAAVLLSALGAQAALVSFDLDRSNVMADGPAWLRVSIDDQGLPGRINFHVGVLDPLRHLSGRDFGIDEFGFNSPFALSSRSIAGLPDDWRWDDGGRMGPFGRFGARVGARRGDARVGELSFSIIGIEGDSVSSYLRSSSRHAEEGNVFFSAHVAGVSLRDCDASAWFGGRLPVTAVPLSPAFGLLMAGLGGLWAAGLRRRVPVRR